MAKPKKRALPRTQREYPQGERIFSTNFLSQMLAEESRCFVPLNDYQKLQKKYIRLFKRYKRGRN